MVHIKSNARKKIWVDEDFARLIKTDASMEGKSIMEFTRELADRKFKGEKKNNETFKFGL